MTTVATPPRKPRPEQDEALGWEGIRLKLDLQHRREAVTHTGAEIPAYGRLWLELTAVLHSEQVAREALQRDARAADERLGKAARAAQKKAGETDAGKEAERLRAIHAKAEAEVIRLSSLAGALEGQIMEQIGSGANPAKQQQDMELVESQLARARKWETVARANREPADRAADEVLARLVHVAMADLHAEASAEQASEERAMMAACARWPSGSAPPEPWLPGSLLTAPWPC